jgi:hypothetical protein
MTKTITELAIDAGVGNWDSDFGFSIQRFATAIKAAHLAELLAGVEMPEPFGLFCGIRHDPPKTKEFWGMLNQNTDPQLKCNLYTADQMREYAAAAVARKDAYAIACQTEADELRTELAQRDKHMVEYNSKIAAEMEVMIEKIDALTAERDAAIAKVVLLREALQDLNAELKFNRAPEDYAVQIVALEATK